MLKHEANQGSVLNIRYGPPTSPEVEHCQMWIRNIHTLGPISIGSISYILNEAVLVLVKKKLDGIII